MFSFIGWNCFQSGSGNGNGSGSGFSRAGHHLTAGSLEGEALQAITLTGVGIWYSPRAMLPSAAERRVGEEEVGTVYASSGKRGIDSPFARNSPDP